MIKQVTDKAKELIEAITWADQVYGVVRPIIKVQQHADSKISYSTLPVAENPLNACTTEGNLISVSPDGKKNVVIWMEDRGTRIITEDKKRDKYESDFRIVVWINSKKFTAAYSAIPMMMQQEIISALQAEKGMTEGTATNIYYKLAGIPEQDPSLITKWSFSRDVTDPPYNYFALDFKAIYLVPENCFTPLELSDDACN
jgi:hypothetical protein